MVTEIDELRRNAATLDASRTVAAPGVAERMFQQEQAQGILANVADGFKGTALYKLGRFIRDETPVAWDAFREQGFDPVVSAVLSLGTIVGYSPEPKNYDKRGEQANKLLEGVPFEYWEDILAHDNYAAAQRQRGRIMENLDRGRRLAGQTGAASTIAMIAGGMVDIDLPLAFASGGALTATKVMQKSYQVGRTVGLKSSTSIRAASTVGGAAAVAEAAAVVGVAAQAVDPTMGWDDVMLGVLMGAPLGGLIGSVATGSAARAVVNMQNIIADTKVMRPAEKVDTDVIARADEGAVSPAPFVMEFDDLPEELADEVVTNGKPIDVPGPPGPDNSVGAARVAKPARDIQTPFTNTTSDVDKTVIRNYSDYLDRTGMRQDLEEVESTLWGGIMHGSWVKENPDNLLDQALNIGKKAITRAVNITGNDVMKLVRSKSNVANGLFLQIFENPAAYARGSMASTAATLKKAYEGRIASTMVNYGVPMRAWAARTGNTMRIGGHDTGLLVSAEGRKAFNREVYLNLNDIRAGRPMRALATGDTEIIEAVAMVQAHGRVALDIAKGTSPRNAVKGMDGLDYDDAYIPQAVNGSALAADLKAGVVNLKGVQAAFSEGYQNLGMPKKEADIVAKATVGRAVAGELDVNTGMLDMLNEDGREFLRQRLTAMGHSEAEVETIITKLTGLAEERGRQGWTKHRNDLDLEISIPTLNGERRSLVDYMETDVEDVLHRYRRGLSGAAALARKGIRSTKELDVVFRALRTEQESLGEEAFDSDWLHAMFSEFRAGPAYGYAFGKQAKGIDPGVAVARDAANLSLLHSLGFAQLAEEGNNMAVAGFTEWRRHQRAFLGFEEELRQANTNLLEDLAPLVGDIGKDHTMFRAHVNLDEVDRGAEKEWFKGVRRHVQNLSAVQAYTSLFNTVRSHQQQLAATVLSNKVLRHIKNGEHTDRIKHDLGITDELFDNLKDMIDNGTIEFKTLGGQEYVNRLNPAMWSADLRDEFASIMVRGQSRMVQSSLAGEQDLFYRTNAGALLGHLKMFPLTALPKQFMRNAKFMDTEAMAQVMYGMATAYVALTVRDKLQGNERGVEERARAAFSYSNTLGWIPMGVDPMATMLGLGEYRISKYGRDYEMSIPAIEVANKAMRIPGAVINWAQGDMTNRDKSALLAIPFARTLGIRAMVARQTVMGVV